MMDPRPHASRSDPSQALGAALRSRGFEIDDFRLEEDRTSELSDLLGVAGGALKVRCRSTGEVRIYSLGASSTWLGAFVMDLGKGHFARAARRADVAEVPMSRLIGPPLHA